MYSFNSLTTKKKMAKFSSANCKEMLSTGYIILRTQRLKGNSVDLDELANYEPPHQVLHCLKIRLFSSLVLKELSNTIYFGVCSLTKLYSVTNLFLKVQFYYILR